MDNIPEEITTIDVQAPHQSEYQTILSILDKGEHLADEIEKANRVIEDELEKNSTLEKESKGSGQHYSFRSNNSLRKRANNLNETINSIITNRGIQASQRILEINNFVYEDEILGQQK